MNFTIIEDCSPYYIRFTHDGIDNVISKSLSFIEQNKFKTHFTHYVFPLNEAIEILSVVPMTSLIELNPNRVSIFVTPPGIYYKAHKDGRDPDHHYSLNYTVKILDQECVTNWYSDEDLKDYELDMKVYLRYSRECLNFDKSKHTPLKSMTALQGECILFNTEIYHDFDNSKSINERMVLTLRDINPADVYFEDIKKVIFNK